MTVLCVLQWNTEGEAGGKNKETGAHNVKSDWRTHCQSPCGIALRVQEGDNGMNE